MSLRYGRPSLRLPVRKGNGKGDVKAQRRRRRERGHGGGKGDRKGQYKRRYQRLKVRAREKSILERGYPPAFASYARKMARLYHWAAVTAGSHASSIKTQLIRPPRPSRARYSPEERIARREAWKIAYRAKQSEEHIKGWDTSDPARWLRDWSMKSWIDFYPWATEPIEMSKWRRQYAQTDKGRAIKRACSSRFNRSWKMLLIQKTGVCWSDYQKLDEEGQCAVRVLFLSPICNRFARQGSLAKLRPLEREAFVHLKISVTF